MLKKAAVLTRPAPARKTRRSAGKAAASEEARRYQPHFVGPFAHTNGSWRAEKPLTRFLFHR